MKTLILFLAITFLISYKIYSQWDSLGGPCGGDIYISHLSKTNNFIFCATFGCGIFKSSDLGITWIECNSGLTNLNVNKIVHDGMYQYAATSGHGVFRSSNEGESWIPVNNGRTKFDVSEIFERNGKLITGTGDYSNINEVLISTNFGENWQPFFYTELVIKTSFLKDNDVFIGGRAKVFGGIYKTTNSGQNWRRVLADFPLYMTSYDSIFYAGALNGVYMSTNNGNNWSSISNGLPNGFSRPVNCIIKHNNFLFASLYDEFNQYGVYRSDNLGLNWYSFNEGFNFSCDPTSLLEMDDYLFTSTASHGLWKRPITITNINSFENNNLFDFNLSQNYPNPFNPTTVIRYSIIENRFVSLKVYDTIGKEIATLVNEKQNAGNYEVEFNGTNYSSGIYFYKLVSESFSQTKQMLLIK
jgi:hypothetical protein